jgi:hypothetical protein
VGVPPPLHPAPVPGQPRCAPAAPTRCACARRGCCALLPRLRPCPAHGGPGLHDRAHRSKGGVNHKRSNIQLYASLSVCP